MPPAETTMRRAGNWSRPDVPHKGWTCVDIEDLGAPSRICEMCEAQEIRYVHHMTHPDHPEPLGCGCICAGRMEDDYVAARERERILRNAAGRRRGWLHRAWRKSSKGNSYINTRGYNVTLYRQQAPSGEIGWAFRVTKRAANAVRTATKLYRSSDDAKLAAFDVMTLMERGK